MNSNAARLALAAAALLVTSACAGPSASGLVPSAATRQTPATGYGALVESTRQAPMTGYGALVESSRTATEGSTKIGGGGPVGAAAPGRSHVDFGYGGLVE